MVAHLPGQADDQIVVGGRPDQGLGLDGLEVAGAAGCLITDAWQGIEHFLEPGRECLVANNGDEVGEQLRHLSRAQAKEIGQAALRRILGEHTYAHRAAELESLLQGL